MTSALQCYHENGALHADGTPMPGWGAVFRWMCRVLSWSGTICSHSVEFDQHGAMMKKPILKMMQTNRLAEEAGELTNNSCTYDDAMWRSGEEEDLEVVMVVLVVVVLVLVLVVGAGGAGGGRGGRGGRTGWS